MMKSIHDGQFRVLVFYKTEHLHLKVWLNKVGENGYCRDAFSKQRFSHIFPVILKAQNYRVCGEKTAMFGNSKSKE